MFCYCSKECQKKDWLAHHKHLECSFFKDIASSSLKDILDINELLAVRVYLTLQKRPDLKTQMFHFPDGSKRCFNDLMTNLEALSNDQYKMNNIAITGALLNAVIPDFDQSQLVDVYGKVCTNSYTINDDEGTERLGHAIYIQHSKCNHSCKPNAVPVSKGLKHEVRAITDIPVEQEITVSYIDPLEVKDERRRILKEDWFFHCECSRCLIDDDDDVNKIKGLREKMETLALKSSSDSSLESFETGVQLIGMIQKVLGEYHSTITGVLRTIVFCRSGNESLSQDRKNLKNLIEKTSKAIAVTHGQDHPQYLQFQQLKQMLQSCLNRR